MSAEITRRGSTSCAQPGIDPVIFQELEDRLGEIAKSFFSERARFWSSTDEQVKNLIQTGKGNAFRARVGSLPLAKAHEYSLEVTRLQNTTSLDYQTVLSEIKSISQLLESNVLVSEAIKAGPQFYRVLEVNGTLSYIALAPNGELIDLSKWTDEELKAGAVRKTVYKNPQDLPLVDSALPQAELIKLAKQCGPQYWREVEINGTLNIVFRIVDGRFVDLCKDTKLQEQLQQLAQNPSSVKPQPAPQKNPITRERIQTISTAYENTYSTYSEYVRQDELSGKDPGKHLAAIIVTKAKIEKFYAAALRQGKSAQELSTLRTGIDRIAQLESLITAAIDRYDAYENLTTPQKVELLRQTTLRVEEDLKANAQRIADHLEGSALMTESIDLEHLRDTMEITQARVAQLPKSSSGVAALAKSAQKASILVSQALAKQERFDQEEDEISLELYKIENVWGDTKQFVTFDTSTEKTTIVNPRYNGIAACTKERVTTALKRIQSLSPQNYSQVVKYLSLREQAQKLNDVTPGTASRLYSRVTAPLHTGTRSKLPTYYACGPSYTFKYPQPYQKPPGYEWSWRPGPNGMQLGLHFSTHPR